MSEPLPFPRGTPIHEIKPGVYQDDGIRFGRPMTRQCVSTYVLWDRYAAGDGIADLIADYGDGMSERDVICALRFEARRRHRRMPDVCRSERR